MTHLTNKQLANLKTLHDAATQGEWQINENEEYMGGFCVNAESEEYCIADTRTYYPEMFSRKNTEYIVALHNSFPAIIKELEAARELVKGLEKMVGHKGSVSETQSDAQYRVSLNNLWEKQRDQILSNYRKALEV